MPAGFKQYSTAAAFRIALEDRLNRWARERGLDVLRIRRQVAFDRFLARLFTSQKANRFVLKGGYALELRFQRARTTKDIDICMSEAKGIDLHDGTALRRIIQDLAMVDLGDYFVYTIGESTLDLENAPYGGFRYPVECQIAGRRFAHFSVDLAMGDVWLGNFGRLSTQPWLEFAGIPSPEIPSISPEQQFAEKLHAYTLPRESNSRVKDLVDMVLLIDSCEFDSENLVEAISQTFGRRKTHPMPSELPPPPESWRSRFEAMAQECDMPRDFLLGFQKVREIYQRTYLALTKKT